MKYNETKNIADISMADAEAKGITNGEMIWLKSRQGKVLVKARINRQVPQGQVWMEEFPFPEGSLNYSQQTACGPIIQTTEYETCAACIEKIK